jgi:hypothetical protein
MENRNGKKLCYILKTVRNRIETLIHKNLRKSKGFASI